MAGLNSSDQTRRTQRSLASHSGRSRRSSASTIHQSRTSHFHGSSAAFHTRGQSFRLILGMLVMCFMYVNIQLSATISKEPLAAKRRIDESWKVDCCNKSGEVTRALKTFVLPSVENKETNDQSAQFEKHQQKESNSPKKKKKYAFDMEFDWSDVDFTKNGNCGWHKCYWPSISNSTVGYLVAEEKQKQQMIQAVDVALGLEKRYHSKHFHLDLFFVNVTTEFRDRLNSLVEQPARRTRGLDTIEIYKSSNVVIEKVQVAPKPGLFFATKHANLALTVAQLAEFRSMIPDKESFHLQLRAEHEKLKRVLSDNPSLSLDFQGVIDPAGNFYHIDLDGHMSMAKRDNNEERSVAASLDLLYQVTKNLTTSDIWIMHHFNSTKKM